MAARSCRRPCSSLRTSRPSFPYDPRGTYGERMFIDRYPGGVLHTFFYLLDHFSGHARRERDPGPLPPEKERLWKEAMNNPDFKMYGHIYNILVQKGQHMPAIFDILINPYDTEEGVQKVEAAFEKIKIPVDTGAGWYAYTYKLHLQGASTCSRRSTGAPTSSCSPARPTPSGRSTSGTTRSSAGTTTG